MLLKRLQQYVTKNNVQASLQLSSCNKTQLMFSKSPTALGECQTYCICSSIGKRKIKQQLGGKMNLEVHCETNKNDLEISQCCNRLMGRMYYKNCFRKFCGICVRALTEEKLINSLKEKLTSNFLLSWIRMIPKCLNVVTGLWGECPRTIFKWVQLLREGRKDFNAMTGRPFTSSADENLDPVVFRFQ